MQDSPGIRESASLQASGETDASEALRSAEGRRGSTWCGWVLSILVAIILSVTATLLLGGSGAFRSDGAIGSAAGHSGSGAGSGCCPPAGAGK